MELSYIPGVLIALVGVDGAGKATLIGFLAGRKTYIGIFQETRTTSAPHLWQSMKHSCTRSAWLQLAPAPEVDAGTRNVGKFDPCHRNKIIKK